MKKLLLLIAVAGCTAAPEQAPVDFDDQPRCGAENYEKFVGRNASVLDSVDLPSTHRILRPGDAITLDFSTERLTIDVDESGIISSVTCR